jgi:ribonuclease BN (tRNA processing enzyme)
MQVYSFGSSDGFPASFEAPAFLIKEGKELWMIDCPPHANLFLKEIELSAMDLTAVLITHLHNDHVGGLVELIQMRMICLTNRELMKQADYYQNIATEVLPIYVFGYDQEWWLHIEKLIDLNCPAKWGDWRNFHKVILLEQELEQGSMTINGLTVEFRKTLHDVNCYGLKIDGCVAISGDTPYDAEYVKWLCKEVNLVFHEAGFGGSHLTPEWFETVSREQDRLYYHQLYFYHIPSGARKFFRGCKATFMAKKGWSIVHSYIQLYQSERN